MLGVICQPGLSCRARAALGGKELDTVLSLFTPTHNGGHANINPHSCPLFLALLLASRGVLPSIWTAGRQQGRGALGGLIAGRCREKCDISPIRSLSCHILELEMMGCSLRPCLASPGSRGDPSPSTLCPSRESVQGGREKEGGNVRVLCVLLCYIMNEFGCNDYPPL